MDVGVYPIQAVAPVLREGISASRMLRFVCEVRRKWGVRCGRTLTFASLRGIFCSKPGPALERAQGDGWMESGAAALHPVILSNFDLRPRWTRP